LMEMDTAKVGAFLYFEPFVTVFSAWLILNEHITLMIILSGIIITSGVILVNKKLKSKGITLLFSEKDIISKYETIEKNIKKIKTMMPYVEIEISGTLKKKLTGD